MGPFFTFSNTYLLINLTVFSDTITFLSLLFRYPFLFFILKIPVSNAKSLFCNFTTSERVQPVSHNIFIINASLMPVLLSLFNISLNMFL
uniref:Uncharacterized protein n=1 Tax=Methanococcus maripaludis (strain C5 / ATCC BAA-1333) TaxID=402880 RepID=O06109_METM5|nr:unknown [Methanococcus maripaludis C5]